MICSSTRSPRVLSVAAFMTATVLLAGAGGLAAADAGADVKQVLAEKLPNVPGKSITAVVVNYAPGGKSGKHHHAGSVFAYVLSGAIRSENSATGPRGSTARAKASSSPLAASIW
jgi:uncharacterized RmlC-like cupin family protein